MDSMTDPAVSMASLEATEAAHRTKGLRILQAKLAQEAWAEAEAKRAEEAFRNLQADGAASQ
jgi:hypothetical protein